METTLTATPGSKGHLEEMIDMIRDIISVILHHNSMSSIGVDIIDQIPIIFQYMSIHSGPYFLPPLALAAAIAGAPFGMGTPGSRTASDLCSCDSLKHGLLSQNLVEKYFTN